MNFINKIKTYIIQNPVTALALYLIIGSQIVAWFVKKNEEQMNENENYKQRLIEHHNLIENFVGIDVSYFYLFVCMSVFLFSTFEIKRTKSSGKISFLPTIAMSLILFSYVFYLLHL